MFSTDTIFLFIWISLPIFWQVLLNLAGLSLLRLTLPSFVISMMYLFQYLGIPLLYFHIFEYRVETGVSDPELILKVWLYTSFTITLMLLGFIVARVHWGKLDWRQNTHSQTFLSHHQKWALTLLGIFSLLVLYLYLLKVGFKEIAIFVVMGLGSDISPDLARSAMGNSFPGKYHWYQLAMRDILSFVWLAFFLQYSLRRDWIIRGLLIFLGTALLFSLTMAIEKAPIADFILSVMLAIVLFKFHGKIPVRVLFQAGLIVVGTLMLTYALFMNSNDTLSSVASRAFTGSIQPAYHYLEFFPQHQDWLLGRSFPNPGDILPFQPFALTEEVMNWKFPYFQEQGIVGSMPTIFWGESYANFSIFGVILLPFFVGYLLYAGNYLIFAQKPTPVTMAFFIWLLMHYGKLSVAGISGFIIDMPMVVFVLIFLFLQKFDLKTNSS